MLDDLTNNWKNTIVIGVSSISLLCSFALGSPSYAQLNFILKTEQAHTEVNPTEEIKSRLNEYITYLESEKYEKFVDNYYLMSEIKKEMKKEGKEFDEHYIKLELIVKTRKNSNHMVKGLNDLFLMEPYINKDRTIAEFKFKNLNSIFFKKNGNHWYRSIIEKSLDEERFSTMTELTKIKEAEEKIRMIGGAVIRFACMERKNLRTLNDLVGKYLIKLPKDPWNNNYYLKVREKNNSYLEKGKELVGSNGPDRIKGTSDDIVFKYE
tara:strand:+ start:7921 stop:8718 length:798 start_codon:yes stop_codon:yes gene_type:complete